MECKDGCMVFTLLRLFLSNKVVRFISRFVFMVKWVTDCVLIFVALELFGLALWSQFWKKKNVSSYLLICFQLLANR